tara:strand:- start:6410 stop:6799 length:390 start_codon:yes stop_codon:yes gene_type:complete
LNYGPHLALSLGIRKTLGQTILEVMPMKLSRCLLFISALLCSFSAQALYIQMEDDGFIIAYTYDQFLTGNGGIILGQVPAYGDDAGFFVVPDDMEEPTVPAPMTPLLLGLGLVALVVSRRRGAATRTGD